MFFFLDWQPQRVNRQVFCLHFEAFTVGLVTHPRSWVQSSTVHLRHIWAPSGLFGNTEFLNSCISYEPCLLQLQYWNNWNSCISSRNQSPLVLATPTHQRLLHSPSIKMSPGAGLSRTPLSFDASARPETDAQVGLEPVPEVCLNHLWTETNVTRFEHHFLPLKRSTPKARICTVHLLGF